MGATCIPPAQVGYIPDFAAPKISNRMRLLPVIGSLTIKVRCCLETVNQLAVVIAYLQQMRTSVAHGLHHHLALNRIIQGFAQHGASYHFQESHRIAMLIVPVIPVNCFDLDRGDPGILYTAGKPGAEERFP